MLYLYNSFVNFTDLLCWYIVYWHHFNTELGLQLHKSRVILVLIPGSKEKYFSLTTLLYIVSCFYTFTVMNIKCELRFDVIVTYYPDYNRNIIKTVWINYSSVSYLTLESDIIIRCTEVKLLITHAIWTLSLGFEVLTAVVMKSSILIITVCFRIQIKLVYYNCKCDFKIFHSHSCFYDCMVQHVRTIKMKYRRRRRTVCENSSLFVFGYSSAT
jgi:hypothetical protein